MRLINPSLLCSAYLARWTVARKVTNESIQNATNAATVATVAIGAIGAIVAIAMVGVCVCL